MIQQAIATSTAIILSVSLLSPQPKQQNEDSISHISISDIGRPIVLDNSTSEDNSSHKYETESPRSTPGETQSPTESKHQDNVTSPGVSLGLKMDRDDSRKILQNFRLPTCRITQDEDSHHTPEGGHSFAIDYACVQGVSYDVKAPDFKKEYIVAYIGHDSRLGDYIVLRHGDERWIFGHTQTTRKPGQRIVPGDVIGQSNDSGHSEGIHTHAEYWKGSKNMTFDGKRTNEHSQKLCTQREWQFCQAKAVQANTTKTATPTKKSKVTCRADKAQDMVQYAYDLGGIDFVGTISAESKFDPHAVGDSGMSYGYCQIHRKWNAGTQDKYRALTTNKERMDFCYKIYKGYVEAGNIQNRLYGYNVRYTKGLPKLNIKCQ